MKELKKALEIYNKHKSTPVKSIKRQLHYLATVIGSKYYKQSKYKQALKYFREALKFIDKGNEPFKHKDVLHLIAKTYWKNKTYKLTKETCQKALKIIHNNKEKILDISSYEQNDTTQEIFEITRKLLPKIQILLLGLTWMTAKHLDSLDRTGGVGTFIKPNIDDKFIRLMHKNINFSLNNLMVKTYLKEAYSIISKNRYKWSRQLNKKLELSVKYFNTSFEISKELNKVSLLFGNKFLNRSVFIMQKNRISLLTLKIIINFSKVPLKNTITECTTVIKLIAQHKKLFKQVSHEKIKIKEYRAYEYKRLAYLKIQPLKIELLIKILDKAEGVWGSLRKKPSNCYLPICYEVVGNYFYTIKDYESSYKYYNKQKNIINHLKGKVDEGDQFKLEQKILFSRLYCFEQELDKTSFTNMIDSIKLIKKILGIINKLEILYKQHDQAIKKILLKKKMECFIKLILLSKETSAEINTIEYYRQKVLILLMMHPFLEKHFSRLIDTSHLLKYSQSLFKNIYQNSLSILRRNVNEYFKAHIQKEGRIDAILPYTKERDNKFFIRVIYILNKYNISYEFSIIKKISCLMISGINLPINGDLIQQVSSLDLTPCGLETKTYGKTKSQV